MFNVSFHCNYFDDNLFEIFYQCLQKHANELMLEKRQILVQSFKDGRKLVSVLFIVSYVMVQPTSLYSCVACCP